MTKEDRVEYILSAVDPDLSAAWDRFCGGLPNVRLHEGSILDVECDAIVAPANSFGFMDVGIDAVYVRHFGPNLQRRVHLLIHSRHFGELPVGVADILETGSEQIPHLIFGPHDARSDDSARLRERLPCGESGFSASTAGCVWIRSAFGEAGS